MQKIVWIFIGFLCFNVNCIGQNNISDPLKKSLPELPFADPKSLGLQPDTIQNLIQLIESTPPNDFRGLVVLKDNHIVVEEYFNTYWRATVHDIRSSGKSITALLLGIAIDQGLIKSVDQSILDFFPKNKYKLPQDEAHKNIKIKHLLMMSSGLAADDDDGNSLGNASNWLVGGDWVNFALNLPLNFKPGEKWVYNDICAVLTGAIIEEVSGKKLADFAKENLFTPLGIREYYWYTGEGGKTAAMGNLYISTLDFAKIGSLVLNKGKWQGKQIISENWIKEISQKRMDLSEISPFAKSYGYFWYLGEKQVNQKKYEYVFASGNGGNLLFILPNENMVVALTSSAYGQGYGHHRAQNILASILKSLNSK